MKHQSEHSHDEAEAALLHREHHRAGRRGRLFESGRMKLLVLHARLVRIAQVGLQTCA